MAFLKNIFGKKEEPVKSYSDFWNWFQKNEKDFFKAVKQRNNIEKDFFDKLSQKLGELKDGFFYLAGMYDDDTVELVITAEGIIKNIVFVEELVDSAPSMPGWKFTALKPALDKGMNIEMEGYKFNKDNLFFYANQQAEYPDEIDITIVHNDINEENKAIITNGTCIFLDNYIGELNFVTTIDNLLVVGKQQAQKELIPIEKLKDFLIWRKKEFVEKYDGVMLDTENANHSILEAELESGNVLIATVNTDILNWDKKASHPWIATVEIKYDGKNNNGMPDQRTSELLYEIEDEIMKDLKDFDGYLNIGRQTAEGVREIYFACKDFRKPSKVLHEIQGNYEGEIDIAYEIYIDKYWQSFNRFIRN